jgi:hypothetical protein
MFFWQHIRYSFPVLKSARQYASSQVDNITGDNAIIVPDAQMFLSSRRLCTTHGKLKREGTTLDNCNYYFPSEKLSLTDAPSAQIACVQMPVK